MSFHDKIIDIIDQSDDIQNHETNVKAKMTSWEMMGEPGFKNLINPIIEFARFVSKDKYQREEDTFGISKMWGTCYENEDYCVPHDHLPSYFSSVYYIDPPENGPELIFPELNESIQPKNGMLVLFPCWVVHEVPKKTFSGKRYAVAANIERIPAWWKNVREVYSDG